MKQKWNKGKSFAKSNNRRSDNKKKELKDYIYYTGSNRQASDFKTTTEFIINYIKDEFTHGNDIAEALRKLEYEATENWYPKLEISKADDEETKIRETKENDIKYKAKLDATVKREQIYENNKTKSYSIIWERCSRNVQSKIEQRTDFKSEVYNNPVKLLAAIKEHTLDYQESKYSMETINKAIVHFLLLKQKEEPLHEYIKRFKTTKEVAELHIGGPIMLTKYLKS